MPSSLPRKLVRQAVGGDQTAIKKLFETFVGTREPVSDCAYLGVRGLWGFGHHCWAAVTERRFATLTVGPLGDIRYQDIFADRVDRVQFQQPSGFVLAGAVVGIMFGVFSCFTGFASFVGAFASLVFEDDFDFEDNAFTDYLELIAADWDGIPGWDVLLISLATAIALFTSLYIALAIARRFIKRGIECRSKSASVETFCEGSATPHALRIMRQVAVVRDHKIKSALGS
jgi:hypothetical protein